LGKEIDAIERAERVTPALERDQKGSAAYREA
jgi:hypothetical protein